MDGWFKTGTTKPLPSTTGAATTAVDSLVKLPRSNRMAVGKQYLSLLSLFKDAKEELEELKKPGEAFSDAREGIATSEEKKGTGVFLGLEWVNNWAWY